MVAVLLFDGCKIGKLFKQIRKEMKSIAAVIQCFM